MGCRLLRLVLLGLVAGAAVVACGPDLLGEEVGDGRLLTEEAVYPGEAGPLLGGVARGQVQAAELWDTVGFDGSVPDLEGDALVVLTGGEAGNCPWELGDVDVDGTTITLALGEPDDDRFCEGAWHPRALAVAVPTDAPSEAVEVVAVHPWGEAQTATPIEDRPDPVLWQDRVLSSADVEQVGGCGDAWAYAVVADDAVLVTVRWDGAASRAATEGGFADEVALPHAQVEVGLQVGSALSEGECTDMILPGRPLVAGGWTAVSGRVAIEVERDEETRQADPRARMSLRLEDVELAPEEDTDGAPWSIEELDLTDADVGWAPG